MWRKYAWTKGVGSGINRPIRTLGQSSSWEIQKKLVQIVLNVNLVGKKQESLN